jgi:nitrogen fixation-related uncharacterized protein
MDEICDECDKNLKVEREKRLGAGIIILIVVVSIAVSGMGAFSALWFAVKKKSFNDLLNLAKPIFVKKS